MNISYKLNKINDKLINLPFFIYRKKNLNSSKFFKLYFLLRSYLVTIIFKKLNRGLLCFLMNLFYGTDGKIEYDNKNRLYIKNYNSEKIFFPNKFRISGSMVNHEFELLNLLSSYCINDFEFSNSDLIVDCGANTGMFYLAFKKFIDDFKYIGFEPDADAYKCLNLNIAKYTNVNLYDVALSNKETTSNLYVSSLFGDTSLEEFQSDEIKKVQTKSLDSFNITNIKLLKIDAEGHELALLRGSKNTLLTTEYICVDMGAEKGKYNLNTVSEVTNFLLSHNFKLVNFNEKRITGLFKNLNY